MVPCHCWERRGDACSRLFHSRQHTTQHNTRQAKTGQPLCNQPAGIIPKTSQDNTGQDKATLVHKRLSSNPGPNRKSNTSTNPNPNPNPNPESNPNPDPRGTNFWKGCAKLRTVKLQDTFVCVLGLSFSFLIGPFYFISDLSFLFLFLIGSFYFIFNSDWSFLCNSWLRHRKARAKMTHS